MKNIIAITIITVIATLFTNCTSNSNGQTASFNKDSVRTIIMDIHNKMMEARNESSKEGNKKYASYCDDSLLCSENTTFMTSAYALSQDLLNGSIVPPHDYIFRLMGTTALLSYVETTYEFIGIDSAFQNRRITKVFVLKNGDWKMGGIFINPADRTNYTKAVVEKNQSLYKEYAGIYQWKPAQADTFFVQDGKLYDAMTDGPRTLSFPVSDSEYMSKTDLGKVIFGKDANGKVSYYTYVLGDGQRLRIPKVK